jgi:hypothetical protein
VSALVSLTSQNGLFWEVDGKTLYAVKRSSTFQLAGLITVNVNAQTMYGTTDTSVPTAVISNCYTANTIDYGETTAVLQNITYSGGTLYRGMPCSIPVQRGGARRRFRRPGAQCRLRP